MPYLTIEDFKSGLDRRRSRFAGIPGSLWDLKNGHITRGGEIEGMKKWVSTYTVAGTFGLFGVNNTLYVFGSAASGSLSIPAGVTYQRLRHPDLSTAMTKVVDVQAFDGKPYVVAKFADGNTYHYYDGTIVTDRIAGVVRADMTDNNGIATALAALFTGDPYFSASVAGNVVTVTGGDNSAWTYETETANVSGGVNNQTLAASVNQAAIAGAAEHLAVSSFVLTGGTPAVAATGSVTITGGSSGSFTQVLVNGVDVLGATVAWTTDASTTAAAVAAQINTYTSSPNYSASAVGAVITISAAQAVGAVPNGYVVASSVTGTITKTDANMGGGVSNGVSSVKVDGIEVLGATVNMLSSYSVLAAAIASQITTYTSSPDYTGGTDAYNAVYVYGATGSGATPNGKVVSITTVGNVTVSAAPNMAGGVTATGGQPQKTNFTVGGTFEAGDKFTIRLTKGTRVAVFGASGQPAAMGQVLFTFKTKMYSAAGSIVDFSAVQAPTLWNLDRVEDGVAGMGFINISTQDEGSQSVTAMNTYNGTLAIFSENSIQTWSVNTDPDQNTYIQTLQNTGTASRRSVVPFGNSDTLYLDKTGIRSLKIRDYVNAPYSDDVGSAIDTFVQEYLASLSDSAIADACGVIEPLDNRYFLAVSSRIFVFSFYPRSKISAWSYYQPGFAISDFAKIGKKLYARSGDTVYLYGGSAGATFPGAGETPLVFELPFLAMGKPSTKKKFRGVDLGGLGTWQVKVRPNLNDDTVEHNAGSFTEPTFNKQRMAAGVIASHVSVQCTCESAGQRKMANMTVFFTESQEPE